MKKVRIMLAAIIVLGTVGGALAFKAKKYSPIGYCYKANSPGTCTIGVPIGSTAQPGLGTIYYTTTNNTSNCPALTCPSRAVTIVPED